LADRAQSWPRIVAQRRTRLSPWVEIIARDVEPAPAARHQTWHAIGQADYVTMIARTPDRLFPMVRQFRPAIEGFSWEFPAGTVDPGEEPAQSAQRELLEETGYPTLRLHTLGAFSPCPGRLSNRQHSFFIETGERETNAVPEAGIEVVLMSWAEILKLIERGELVSQIQLGALALAHMRGFVDLPRL
jgi:ADP-ribose pyrophosphatase